MKALVVGGGPAGASAAMGLNKMGFEVKLIDQRPVWNGRVCGSFMSPEASLHLEKLNLIPQLKNHAIAVPDTRLTTPSGLDKVISIRQRNRPGLALSRQELESILLHEAEKIGVDYQTGHRLVSYEKNSSGWTVAIQEEKNRTVRHIDILVLADGRYSLASAGSAKVKTGWFGFNALFENCPQSPGEQSLHFFPGGYVGVLTFSNGTTNVCGLIRRPFEEKISWDDIFLRVRKKSPALEKLLFHSRKIGDWRGVGPLPFGIHLQSNGPILVGDAAAVADPFMGEGIGRALSAGPMLMAAIRILNKRNLPISDLSKIYFELWKKSYSKRWRFNQVLRGVISNPFSFLILEGLIRVGPFVKSLAAVLHQGFETTPSHELP